ncbi:HEPN family nuclease [Flavobacterium restrictum]|uniref:pEK499-p136 HEPN domain-containing protein n=1 Tax=Flavobacterium restrictum TaxID=2594428 RepID=A0A553DMT7_9FLAO|nr:HEPN family nuclease [Flavobacterium restrictum]TRX33993.1 hypothetical protein FNW21_16050 [Flavobacterium restrictum]
MSSIKNYQIDFVNRTKKLLSENFEDFKNRDLESTLLLNCLLGLIVVVSENEKNGNKSLKGKIDESFLNFIPQKIGFLIKSQHKKDLTEIELTNIQTEVGHRNDLTKFEKLWFVNKIRNGIAHQNIEGINENDLWIGIKLWNTNNEKTKDFEVIFTMEELKKLALKIAEDYIISITK